MEKKKIVLITGTEHTRITLEEQLKSYIGDLIHIRSYAVDEGMDGEIRADLVIISTDLIYEDALRHIPHDCRIIVTRRMINYSQIERILFIPPGEKILFVNDCRETAFECIEWFERLGIKSYNYIPFYPGCKCEDRDIRYAVTPGEVHLVPGFIENTIDIGPRLIDITTMTEILKEFNLFEEKWADISTIYLSKIIDMGKHVTRMAGEKAQAYDHVMKVIDSVNEGLLAFYGEGRITVFNENLRFILGVPGKSLVGSNVREIIKNREMMQFLFGDRDEEIMAMEIRGMELLVTRFIMKEDNTTVVIFKAGADIKENEKRTRRELYRKGYFAKYTFDDIIGSSQGCERAREIARKLAGTGLTVLIEGESGTGKELYASSIHNASPRSNRPFVAVNFSSLAENLVESEIFGYEEGAFTGAVKGGKPGLFEQADGGTIFLDEIGDISLKVQSRLLRVLQEKEIMRVGGTRIIPVDVRIIAATNQNLDGLVQKGMFRSDLYHRLKVLYIKLPPLRHRREDIISLIHYFMMKEGKNDILIDKDVVEKLTGYPWYGNVRELRNTIDYMLAVCDKRHISVEDLPQNIFSRKNLEEELLGEHESIELRRDYAFILNKVYEEMKRKGKTTRQRLVELAKEDGLNLTEQMVRYRLNHLERMGYVVKNKGKSGTVLTQFGIERVKIMGSMPWA